MNSTLIRIIQKLLPKILTPLYTGAFIYWVMTSQNADKTLDQYIFLTQFSDYLTE